MRVCLLASGSSGNCAYIAAGETHILIDAGISASRIVRELETLGTRPEAIDALLLSHEHGDHCAEIGRAAAQLDCPVYVSARTYPCIRRALGSWPHVRTFRIGEVLEIGDLRIETVRVFHDAIDPCGFLIEGPSHRDRSRSVKLGFFTDLGTVPRPLAERLRTCDALVIEANHDLEMLLGGAYAWDLKQRIRSPIGHLSNAAAAELIAELACFGRLKVAMLAHLSEENNRPELALETVRRRLDGLFSRSCEVYWAPRDRRSELLEL